MTLLKKFLRNDACIGLALALGSLLVYIPTLSPSLAGEEDQGELAAAAHTLGNTHPTGYPLFALLGRAFSLLPLGDLRVIAKLNLMTAAFSAAGLFFLYHLFVLLLRGNAIGARDDRRGNPAPVDGLVRTASAIGVLTLAFSEQYWKNALNLEVYGLHMLFIAVITLLFVTALREAEKRDDRREGIWLLFVYATGLSFAHHMMTVLLAPAFLWAYFSIHGLGASAWRKILRAAPLFLLGLSAYIYLPLRAAVRPPANWGNPASLHEFWLHVSGHQYKAMMFTGLDVPLSKLALFLERFPAAIGYLPLAAAAWGLAALWRRDARAAAFTLLLFFACLFYALNYDFDDPNFYLNLWMVTAFWTAAGVLAVFRLISSVRMRKVAVVAAFIVPAFPLILHYPQLDDSRNHAAEDFAKNMLGTLDSGAVIISNQSQYLTSPALYLQFVEGYRPDIVVLQESALGFYSYHLQLKSRYPEFMAKHLPDSAWAGNGLSDSGAFIALYRRTIDAVVGLRDEHPVYFSPDIDVGRFYRDVKTVPEGLALRAYGATPPPLSPPRTFRYRPLPAGDADIENIRSYYATAYVNQALLHGHVNDTAVVIDMLRKALAVKPGFPNAARMLRWVQYGY